MAKLSHPGIVTIHDFGQTDGLFYFLMEFVDGVTLWQLLSAGRVSPREALAIVPQICDALQYAHDAGIVHRDIKPENILLDRQGRVKVADFGLAKLVEIGAEPVAEGGAPAAAPAQTEAGKVMGTPQYMAPEQRERPQEVDHRADIYSLGVVFYQLLTGELPSRPIEPPSKRVQIDVRLDEVVLKALEKEPQRRYQQASVLKTQVETIASTPPVQPPRERQSERPASGRSLPILAGILFLLPLLLPPAVFIWFLLAGHRTLGVDLDADVQAFTGLLGLPLSAGVGAVLAWASEILRSSLGWASDEIAPATPRRWCRQAIVSVVLLVVSLPLGGGAIVLFQLGGQDVQGWKGWDPGTEELVVTLSLFGGTFLTAAAATLLGIGVLRRIRRASDPLRGRLGALAAAWFWPCMLASLAITLPCWERDRQLQAEHAERQARMVVVRIRTHLKLADQQDLERLVEAIASGDLSPIRGLAIRIAEHEGEKSIPLLIGVMDADNSFETLYSVGYFGLRRLTGVEFSPFHDGAWWRRWWKANRRQFSDEVQTIPIPVFEKTEHGRRYTPFPGDIDTLQGKLRLAPEVLDVYRRRLPDDKDRFLPGRVGLWLFAGDVAKHEDPHAIPYLIGLVGVDKYAVGHFGLSKITGVKYSDRHDAAWWRQWWQENKSKYPADAQAIEIPDFQKPLAFAWREPSREEKKQAEEKKRQEAMADVADVPAQDLTIDGNDRMRYFLIGPRENAAPPKSGFKLVVVMPGGDGGEDFHPFVRRIYKHAMNDEFLVAQPVAFKWRPFQEIVWPTRVNSVKGQEFSTEDFVEAVVRDVAGRHSLDELHVFTLSWSSGGPAAYAISLAQKKSITGSYVAMSVFKPEFLPPLKNARGHAYFIDHSPDDRICPFRMAKAAEQSLEKHGASVRFNTYEGEHGWRGDVYGRIRSGIEWLETHTASDR